MIVVDEDKNLLRISVHGRLTLEDFKELEQNITDELKEYPRVDLLVDLGNMSGFSIDAAMEDIRFNRAHARDFRRIAVVTHDQWLTWLSWLSGQFTEADVQAFPDEATAQAWLSESGTARPD
jgi:hypothetical protein